MKNRLILFIIPIIYLSLSLNTEANSWIKSPLPVHPEKRYDHAMVYDSKQDIIVLFGGSDEENKLGDTWVYNLFTDEWTKMNSSTSPPARQSHAMVYDDINEKVILYGGYGSGNKILQDIWTYDFITDEWIEISGSSLPEERIASSFIYNSSDGVSLLFGGINFSGYLGDTWIYDLASDKWEEYKVYPFPSPREYAMMAYSPSDNIAILFGGNASGNSLNDIWKFNIETKMWDALVPSNSRPEARNKGKLVYSNNGSMILFGGINNEGLLLNDTWTYNIYSNIWKKESSSSSPLKRMGHDMVSTDDGIIMFGGITYHSKSKTYEILDDTWEYKYEDNDPSEVNFDNEPPTMPDNLKAEAISPTQINLIWSPSIDNVGVEGYEIYRGGILIGRSISTLYSDLGLSPNTSYEYAVAAYDLSGNISEPGTSVIVSTFVEDNIPPLISDIKVEDITSSGAIISWTTNEETISYIDYGTTTAYELSAKSNNNYVTIHRITISGIAPSTTYHFRIRSRDRSDNQSFSNDNRLTSLSPFTQDASFIPGQFPFNNNSFPQNNNYNQGQYRQWGCGYIRDSSDDSNDIDKNIFNFMIILSPPIIIKLLSRQSHHTLITHQ
ncbi:MAG: kelch repeat-containing protein [Nitrospirota bacterium]